MSTASIDQAFVEMFDTEVKLDYQRQGSKIANTVRRKTGVVGKEAHFQRAGRGTAGTKARNGNVPLMNITHQRVTCTLEEYFAADFVDGVDELKIQHDERRVIVENASAALGRKADDICATAMYADAGNNTVAGGTGLTEAKVLAEQVYYGNSSIPDDGQRYWLISPECWADLLGIPSFYNADYVGTDDLPWKGGMMAKRYASFMFIPLEGEFFAAGAGGGTELKTINYHGPAVGHATGSEITSRWDYVPEKASHLYNSMFSMGAKVIDDTAVRTVDIVK